MAKLNSTFREAEPTWANACVGNNGSPGNWEYAKGFSSAANLLIDQVLQSHGVQYPVDEFIYPVCFNMRHSVELRLKGAIQQLQKLTEIKGGNLEFDYSGSHDIWKIWTFFYDNSMAIDERYEKINNKLELKISDIAEVDPTGQTFRYPISSESQKHLVDTPLINFLNLKIHFNALESELDKLHRLNKYLIDEYSYKSFTKHLSRNRLNILAKRLPGRITWLNGSFASVKEEIKHSFDISSRELSSAIKIIENHYEFAPFIGLLPPIKGVTEKEIIQFFNEWSKLNEIQPDSISFDSPGLDYFDELGSESWRKGVLSRQQTKKEIWETISSVLTTEMLAGLTTLFYFGDNLNFSEEYDAMYEYQLECSRVAFASSEREVEQEFMHIIFKANAMHNILKTLYFINHTSLAEELVTSYRLESKFSWLDGARSRKLFEKPSYCGYAM